MIIYSTIIIKIFGMHNRLKKDMWWYMLYCNLYLSYSTYTPLVLFLWVLALPPSLHLFFYSMHINLHITLLVLRLCIVSELFYVLCGHHPSVTWLCVNTSQVKCKCITRKWYKCCLPLAAIVLWWFRAKMKVFPGILRKDGGVYTSACNLCSCWAHTITGVGHLQGCSLSFPLKWGLHTCNYHLSNNSSELPHAAVISLNKCMCFYYLQSR